MDSCYFVCFVPGTSGRFLMNILNALLTDSKELMTMTDFNSAHLSVPYTRVSHPNIHSRTIFNELVFDTHINNVPKILTTHVFPNFEIIEKRFINPKIIIISFEQSDISEIAANHVFKNDIITINELANFEDLINDAALINRMQILVTPKYLRYINYISNKENVLVIKYQEIYKKHLEYYIALQKIEDFIGIKANPETLANYNNYVIGRENFVKTYFPWITITS